MKPLCEIIVADILPALRALITKELMDDYGLNQSQVSLKLGITQPAISYYKRELRGNKIKILKSNKKIMNMIHRLSGEIVSSSKNENLHKRFCSICKAIRRERLICKMHLESYPLIKSCNICLR